MKKIISLILLFVLLIPCVSGNAEPGGGSFTPLYVISSGNTPARWMMTESNRAMFAVLLTFDFMNQFIDNLNKAPYDMRYLLFGDMYVGRSKDTLLLAYKNSSSIEYILMLYDTSNNSQTVNYSIQKEATSKDVDYSINLILAATCANGYYKVEPVDLQKALNSIK